MATWTYTPASPVIFDCVGSSVPSYGDWVEGFPSTPEGKVDSVTINFETTVDVTGGSGGAVWSFEFRPISLGSDVLSGGWTGPSVIYWATGASVFVGFDALGGPPYVPGLHPADGAQTAVFTVAAGATYTVDLADVVASLPDTFYLRGLNESFTQIECTGQITSISIDYTPTVGTKPVASFTVDSSLDPEISFDASGSTDDGSIAAYAFHFGDGFTSEGSGSGPYARTYTSNGTYNVTLIVVDDDGDFDSVTHEVIVGGILDPPTITSVSPAYGGQGANAKHLTVTGTNFSSSATVEILKDGLSGVSVNSVTFVDSTNLDIEIHIAGSADVGVYDVLVTNPDTNYYRLSDAFTVTTGPKLSSLSPDSLAQGTSSTVVTINGTGFQAGASIVILNSTADGLATDIVLEDDATFVSSTVLTVPLHVASDAVVSGRLVAVLNPDSGLDFLSPGFTVTAEGGGAGPSISGFSPTHGLASGGTSVVITGSNFTGATSVSFSGAEVPAASFVVNNSTHITAVTPSMTPGEYTINIITADGSCTSGGSFVFANLPTAAFTIDDSGDPTISVDGSGSSGNGRSLASYDWNWGAGGAHGTGSPTDSHTYVSNSTYTITLIVTNDVGMTNSVSHSVTVGSVPAVPVWTNLSIGAFKVGRSYSSTVHASGYPTPTYSVTGGALPDGISLNSSTGQLSGTPTTEGEYTFTITASN